MIYRIKDTIKNITRLPYLSIITPNKGLKIAKKYVIDCIFPDYSF